eukprot:GHVU01218272.1.p1 GENE.GHVU01218272.1~~GHVU01218272.1.p1  ORF type:complete len:141 (+),score=33.79 GHVU01218272.1:58-423(+)
MMTPILPIQEKVVLSCFSDAAYKQTDGTSRLGWKIFLSGENGVDGDCDNLTASWGTKENKQVLDSSTSAELLSLKMVVKAVWEFMQTVEECWGVSADVRVYIDSKPLLFRIRAGTCRAEPR